MSKILRLFVPLLAILFFMTAIPTPSMSSSRVSANEQSTKSQPKKKRQPKKKSSSKKQTPKSSAAKKASSQSRSKRVAQASAYAKRANQKLKAKDYAGALKDFQRADKLNPSKKIKSYIERLTNLLKKREPVRQKPTVASAPAPPEPKSVYEVSDHIYQLTNELDAMIYRMGKAQSVLKPVERTSPREGRFSMVRRTEAKEFTESDSPYALRELALEYERKGMFSNAKDIYLRLIAHDPSNADYHFFVGSLYSKMGQHHNARFAYEEALEIDPDHAATINALSYYTHDAAGDRMASELMKKASTKEPEGQAYYVNEINERLKSGSYEEAITLSNDGSTRFAGNAVFPYLRGQALEALGDMEEAKKSYKLSMTLGTADPSPAAALANLYFDQGNYLYAAITYENVLPLSPMDVDLRFRHGLSYFKSSEWAKSASAWEDLLHYAPNHSEVRDLLPQAYYILSLEYNRSGFSDLGRRSFANALSVNQNSRDWLADALRTAGEYYREQGLYRSSLRAYQDAIELDPGNADNYGGLGVTYWYKGDKEMAIAAWERSISLKPEDNSARGWLLLANRGSGS